MIELISPDVVQGLATGGVAGGVMAISQKIHLGYLRQMLEGLTSRVDGVETLARDNQGRLNVMQALNQANER